MAKTIRTQLSKAEINVRKKILEERAVELRHTMLTHAAANIVARRDEPTDDADRSAQSHEEWIFLNRNSLDTSLLRQIHDALARIEDQSYGICQDCGTPIAAKRLAAVPWATCCITCQDHCN